MNKKTGTTLIVILILQTLVIIWLGFDKYSQSQKAGELQTELIEVSTEKDEVEQELQAMLKQYEDLKTDNEEVNAQLEKEQQKIEELMAELQTVKRSDRYRIRQLEAETETLKNIMRGYIRQIDSLNTMNEQLTAENIQVKQRYEIKVEETKELATERDSLSTQVSKAAILRVYNIEPEPLNRWGRDTRRSGWVKKIKVCFFIAENNFAYEGNRVTYIRIADPDGRILTNSKSGLFTYQGNNIAYSEKRNVDYAQQDVHTCIFWDGEEQELAEGLYNIDIFIDGHIVGSAKFELL